MIPELTLGFSCTHNSEYLFDNIFSSFVKIFPQAASSVSSHFYTGCMRVCAFLHRVATTDRTQPHPIRMLLGPLSLVMEKAGGKTWEGSMLPSMPSIDRRRHTNFAMLANITVLCCDELAKALSCVEH